METRDISLAGRILCLFPEYLTEKQRVADALSELGELVKEPYANVIKLPNISASIPQLTAAIKELQAQGYNLPDYPEDPATEQEKVIQQPTLDTVCETGEFGSCFFLPPFSPPSKTLCPCVLKWVLGRHLFRNKM